MKAIRTRINLDDDFPRIGSGERGVLIEIGRKWVYVTEISTGIRCRARYSWFEKAERHIKHTDA